MTTRVVAGPTLTRKATRANGATRRVAAHRAARGTAVELEPNGRRDLDTTEHLDHTTPEGRRLVLKKRARRKFFGRAVGTMLAEYAKSVDSPLEVAYRRTVYCCDKITQQGGEDVKGETMTSKYCGARWCPVCSSHRTARAWAAYGPIVDTWKRAFFVTLTRRNVSGPALEGEVASMFRDVVAVARGMKRTDKVPLVALRKFECTHNENRDDYHPHFHLIVESRQMARLIVARWLDLCGDRATADAQDARPVTRAALAELLKYFTKLMVKTKFASPAALDTIFRAIKGRRVYQPVGFQAIGDDDEESADFDESTAATQRFGEFVEWEWSQTVANWVDFTTGECLAEYEPGERFRAFVESVAPAEGV